MIAYSKDDLVAECKLLGLRGFIEKNRAVLHPKDVLPHKIPESIKHLTLYTREPKLPEGVALYKNLTSLVIKGNNLSELPADLKDLQSLQALVISGDYFTSELDPKSLPELQGLQMLKISGILLESIPCIGGMKSLKTLSISSNLISLPEEICDLRELSDINLQQNLLCKLPDQLGQLENLRNLNVENNKLQSIPESISGLTNLHSLNLSFNKIRSLPPLHLPHLQFLRLRHNSLDKLDLGGFPSLVELFATGNKLEHISGLYSCQKLKILDISSNKLTKLSSAISSLRNLRELDVRDNLLQSLPVLPRRLREFYCMDNPLQDLNPMNARWFKKHPESIPDSIV